MTSPSAAGASGAASTVAAQDPFAAPSPGPGKAADVSLEQQRELWQQGKVDQPVEQVLKEGYPDCDLWVGEKDDMVTLDKVVVPKEQRGSGAGTAFMEDLCAYADASGKTVALTPSSDFGGSKKRLEEFYRRFGFVPNKGRNKDFSTREAMVRPPTS